MMNSCKSGVSKLQPVACFISLVVGKNSEETFKTRENDMTIRQVKSTEGLCTMSCPLDEGRGQ